MSSLTARAQALPLAIANPLTQQAALEALDLRSRKSVELLDPEALDMAHRAEIHRDLLQLTLEDMNHDICAIEARMDGPGTPEDLVKALALLQGLDSRKQTEEEAQARVALLFKVCALHPLSAVQAAVEAYCLAKRWVPTADDLLKFLPAPYRALKLRLEMLKTARSQKRHQQKRQAQRRDREEKRRAAEDAEIAARVAELTPEAAAEYHRLMAAGDAFRAAGLIARRAAPLPAVKPPPVPQRHQPTRPKLSRAEIMASVQKLPKIPLHRDSGAHDPAVAENAAQ